MAAAFAGCAKQPEPAQQTQETTNGANQSTAQTPDESSKEYVIGCTLQNLSEEFMTMLKGAMEIRQQEYAAAGVSLRLIVNDAEGKPDKQASQLDSFIAQKVDAVIISPVDADALAPAVKSVADAGIPIITCSADVTGDVGQVWVGSENESGGRIEMEYVAGLLGGNGNVAILRGPLGAFAEQGRFRGYEEVLNKNPGIKVVFDQTGNWQREEAMALVENWITTGTEINAIVCQNDGMALGALEAVKAAGKQNEIIITGIDAIKDALDSVKAGELSATCFQDAIGQGRGALEMAVTAAQGGAITRNNIPFELVTKDIVDGYYDRIKLPN
jgi:inositol transport system substrate-binding protein